MVKRRKVKDESGEIDLVENYSTEYFKLRQEQTGKIYGHSVTDVIAGYDEDNIPYSQYGYIETDEKDDPEEEPEDENPSAWKR